SCPSNPRPSFAPSSTRSCPPHLWGGGAKRRRGWSKANRRRDRHQPAVIRLDDLPPALVHQPVMPVAEQDLVLDLTAAAVQPVHQVVPIAPRRRPLAPSPLAVLIARDERPAPRTLDGPLAPSDID